jgi:uncharacterized membrane protein YfcA
VTPGQVALLAAVAFAAALVGVVTGGNSLITVPVMLLVGMEPHRAVGSNMFACTFLALSGALRFARRDAPRLRWDIIVPLSVATLATSWWGARLAVGLDERAVRTIVAGSLIVVGLVLALRPSLGETPARSVSRPRFVAGLALGAALGIYGGLFSGGYTTLLTITCVALCGAGLVEAVALTKLVNFVSSGIASVEFARQGVIDWPVAATMAVAMAAGAWLGAHLALQRGFRWVRALFLLTVAGLAAKLLVWDLLLRK